MSHFHPGRRQLAQCQPSVCRVPLQSEDRWGPIGHAEDGQGPSYLLRDADDDPLLISDGATFATGVRQHPL